jgi:hypothetical protein
LRHLCQVDRERLTEDRESWIMKYSNSRRSWIGGEGLPSRDQKSVAPYGDCQKIFVYMYEDSIGNKRVYMGTQ